MQVEDRVASLQKNLGILNNLITAKAIEFTADPQSGFIRGLISRALPMDSQEEQVAGDLTSLLEDVNVLRIPLGAAGFRGPEGWAALQGMHGNLTGRPDITARVLANTMTALKAQERPLRARFGRAAGVSGGPIQPISSERIPPIPPPPPPTGNVVDQLVQEYGGRR